MNKEAFITLLEKPEQVTAAQTGDLRAVVDAFPYFQSAHALYLKGLKNQGSFTYNHALKVAAAHTTDRAMLFEYITSETFNQNDVSTQIKEQDVKLRSFELQDATDVSVTVEREELNKASQILDPDLFIEKEDSDMTRTPEETLSVGQPLEFSKNETHSFSEWLKLARFRPIDRSSEKESIAQEEPQELVVDEATLSRKRKQQLIDSFIEASPKIQPTPQIKTEKRNLAKERLISQETLMTETLARVYVEQKNYKKAKQAYRILSLKYPEKSGFFADQIRAVEQLEANKE